MLDLVRKARTLDEAEELLARRNISSQRSRTEWNSLFMRQALANMLRSLPQRRPFLQQNGQVSVVGVVLGHTDMPLNARARRIYARQSLKLQRTSQVVEQRLRQLRSVASVSYRTESANAPLPR